MSDRSAGTTDQDREFEMVLDNRKLFSILFITFVLLGVFFAMGYALGRSSAPVDSAARAGVSTPEVSDASSSRPNASGTRVDDESGASVERESPAPPASSAKADPEPPAQTGRTQAQPPPAEDKSTPGAILQPRPGQTFLQVTAVARPEAEILADVLARKGFRAGVAAGPNDNFWRVLVGPAASDTDLAKLKSELEQAGFKPFPRRY